MENVEHPYRVKHLLDIQTYQCAKCEKQFKRKSSLVRHWEKSHRQNELLKLRLKNDHLKLKTDLYIDQIKVLQQLIQFYNLQRVATIRSNGMKQNNLTATNEQ